MTDHPQSDEPGASRNTVPPRATDLPDRLRSLSDRLEDVQAGRDATDARTRRLAGEGAAYGKAMRHVSEFVGGTLAGLALGWLIDRFTGWSPVFTVLGLVLGFVTGFWNIYKASLRRPDTEPR